MDIKDLNKNIKDYENKKVNINGWIKQHRNQKNFGFINLNDGTSQNGIQVVYDEKLKNFNDIAHLLIGCALNVNGTVVKSEGSGQEYEIKADEIILLGNCPEDFPLQAKGRPTREFLREIAYLRPRTNLFRAVFKIRSAAAYAIHKYFQENNYVYVHTPLITASDCEGAGEMFQVTTLDLENIKDGKVDYNKDFFGKKTALTVSGQLQAEAFALNYKKTYTFGPTFRAENSNTKTHASEFWMIEPEIAFCDLEQDMDIMEDMLKYVVKYVLENYPDEMQFFDKYVEKGLLEKLNNLINSKFVRIDHREVIDILKKADVKWEFEPEYGEDIAKEHEKYITEYFNGPVFIKNWPKDIKAFYMKLNPDNETVAAVDLEVPGAGELMGGSQREEDYDKLINRIKELGMDMQDFDWYLNLRRYGGCYHSGFGMGFERLIIYLTGVDNIRDVIPFPRTPGNCEY